MALIKLLGSAPNQVSTNKNFGTMAWQNADGVNITGGIATVTSITVNGTAIPTNGVYLPATNSLGFSTNSVERMRLDANGNLGIGLNNPTQKLQVQSASGGTTARFINTTGGNFVDFYTVGGARQGLLGTTDGVNFSIHNDNATGSIKFDTNNITQLTLFSTGGLSLGNTTDRGLGTLNASGVVITGGYTVATLPTGIVGMRAYVTNALAPVYGATVAGGGAVTIPVFYNGTNWIVA